MMMPTPGFGRQARLMSMMRGYQIGRFNVRRLMKVAGLLPKLPSVHRYQVARTERSEIPNLRACKFDVQQPHQESDLVDHSQTPSSSCNLLL
ncbi:hypothetical protein J4G58_00955 [Aeromonas hydrophila]|nr:hypothetical protein [Aeromonas hydrophila]MBW3831259.1 hypothetical protein [Aeromonas hydrophila]MBW5265539.1 hypothetical protein [Aeromonas hydrophila]MBW5276278.1 hypothetical protein [Aeromonas hydrophila]HEG4446278.1 hypothetical protein [Aeromonas hydrophila]